jgi:Na+-transporting NADH:ubiquinone oxidoreductase subunit F
MMNDFTVILSGVFCFTFVILLLVVIILIAKSKLVPSGNVKIDIVNAMDKSFTSPIGEKLINVLSNNNIFVASACGGQGTCGQCTLKILEGGGALLPIESALLNLRERRENIRLSCQVPVKSDMKIEVPKEIFNVRKWECEVISNKNVATFIKELVLKLPEGEEVDFRAGGYIQIEAEPHEVDFKNFVIEDEYREDWEKSDFFRFKSRVNEKVTRAYSMANCPQERGIIMLNVRIAFPPRGKDKIPPGMMSSYIFNLKPGDKVSISGPYGEFFARDTQKEMVFIGGGAGMAPMRSLIFDQLKRIKTGRKMTFWYGARSKREIFYAEEFEELKANNPNFSYSIALSEPLKSDDWNGPQGFIHSVLYKDYLKNHEAPEDCEYYICGPPLMLSAVNRTLYELGVEEDDILYDDFGE